MPSENEIYKFPSRARAGSLASRADFFSSIIVTTECVRACAYRAITLSTGSKWLVAVRQSNLRERRNMCRSKKYSLSLSLRESFISRKSFSHEFMRSFFFHFHFLTRKLLLLLACVYIHIILTCVRMLSAKGK